MDNKIDKKELTALSVELILCLVAAFIYKKLIQSLSIGEYFTLALALLAAIHGITGHIFKFPFFRQYPEDSEENIKKNNNISFLTMLVGIAIVIFILFILNQKVDL
jgi:hypothetical protein